MMPRIIMLLCLRDGVLVRTKKFVPDYIYTQSYLDTEAVDEVVIVDVGTDRAAFREAARKYADKCFTPIMVGGGLENLERASDLAQTIGADKFLVRWDKHDAIAAIASKFGTQAAVAGVDLHRNTTDPVWAARQAVDHGAGEILLTDADRDGSLQGYNLEALRKVVAAVSVPVIVSGGCGGWMHMAEAFRLGASGAATSVIHHFTNTAMNGFKQSLKASGLEVRV
jgi:cyclase